MTSDLKAFGQKLKALRTTAGLSREALLEALHQIQARGATDDLAIDAQLIWKWETAYTYKGRQWKPRRSHVLYLIEAFADQLNPDEARDWASQAGHSLSPLELQPIFPPNLDWPPAQAPPLPAFYVRRQQLEATVSEKMVQEAAQTVVLWGPGGSGKTSLAVWISRSFLDRFPDGIIWLPLQPDDTVSTIQDLIAENLGLVPTKLSPQKRARMLHSRLQKKRCLLVLDDLLALHDLEQLQFGSQTTRLLITTRDAKVADLLGVPIIPVTRLTDEEGLELLANWAGRPVEGQELIARLGGLPLAVSLAGAQLRAGVPLEVLLGAFREQQVDLSVLDMDDPQTRAESLSLCFLLSYQCLNPVSQHRFAQLGYFAGRVIEEGAIAALWGTDLTEALTTLRQLVRFALLERHGPVYRLHELLHDYARQRLSILVTTDEAVPQRHAAWHVRYALYHPGVLDNGPQAAPDLESSWADVVLGLTWAVANDAELAAQATLLSHTERPALLEDVGEPLIEATAAYLRQVTDPVEQAILTELLGDLYLLRQNIAAGLAQFEQACILLDTMKNGLAGSRAKLRLAGAHLLQQDQSTAADLARQAQAGLKQHGPVSNEDLDEVRGLFYWYNMIYNPLVRWDKLPEADVASLATLAEQTQQPILHARGLRIYSLWCTTRAVPRSEQKRQQGRELALRAYRLWRACERLDQADDEVSFTRFYLQNLYSRRTAARFARRKSEITPQVGSSQIRLIRHEGMRWWLAAAEDQRVAWLRWMLPRYLGARNRPYHPVKTTRLSVLPPDSRAYDWVEAILNIGMLGGTSRRVMIGSEPPANHILNGPEWRVLSGQRVLSLEVNRANRLVENYLSSLEAKLI